MAKIKDKLRKRLLVTLALCVLSPFAVYSCATLEGGPVKGRVVDADSGKPIANAVAYGIWEGSLQKLTRTDENCVWAESVRLDAAGNFLLPAWKKQDSKAPFTSQLVQHIFIYAPGYELTRVSPGDSPDVKVKPFVGTVDERFHKLFITPCVPIDSMYRLAIVYRMMADEMERSAVTVYQRQAAQTAREEAIAARTDRSKPTFMNDSGYLVNVNPNDQYPEQSK